MFLVRKPRAILPKTKLPAFILHQDEFNDYGFQTLYRLSYVYYRHSNDEGDTDEVVEDFIGPVKILRHGQTRDDGLQLTEPFHKLSSEFCSVGTSFDYYERLHALPETLRNEVLLGLRDVVRDHRIEKAFRKEEGWATSLFRDEKDDGYIRLARSLLTGEFGSLPGGELSFSFKVPEWRKDASFRLRRHPLSDSSGMDELGLPGRIAVLIGKNGSGKSTALARLARVAMGTTAERRDEVLKSLGRIEPHDLGFPRVVTVSFSPFDTFKLPGDDLRSKSTLAKELRKGEGRFSFIGLRDISAEGADPDEETLSSIGDADRQSVTTLKSNQELGQDFLRAVDRIREKRRGDQFIGVMRDLLQESPFGDLLDLPFRRWTADALLEAFFHCSTGHKIAALTVACLLASLVPSSLVLFDEPETHLHPPLLAALMHSLRDILEETESYCIMATHSPVVLQEALAENVFIVRREGRVGTVSRPRRETYGESLGYITAEVFGLNAESMDYHAVIDKLVEAHPTQAAIESHFLNERMSLQGRAYALAARSSVDPEPMPQKAKHRKKASR